MQQEFTNTQPIIDEVVSYTRPDVEAAVEESEVDPEDEIECLIEEVRAGLIVKFVVVGKDGQEVVKVFPAGEKHVSKVYEGEQPIGGGELRNSRVKWGSPSFVEKFGFDRPAEPATADTMLVEVDEIITAWIERNCQE